MMWCVRAQRKLRYCAKANKQTITTKKEVSQEQYKTSLVYVKTGDVSDSYKRIHSQMYKRKKEKKTHKVIICVTCAERQWQWTRELSHPQRLQEVLRVCLRPKHFLNWNAMQRV